MDHEQPYDDDLDIGLPEDFNEKLFKEHYPAFLNHVNDTLDDISDILEKVNEEKGHNKILENIGRLVHSMKGQGDFFGYGSVSLVVHDWEDYIQQKSELSENDVSEMYLYIDTIRKLAQEKNQPNQKQIKRILRSLPNSFSVHEIISEKEDIEILTILPNNTQRKVIEDEIHACGFNVISAGSAFEALEICVRKQPDLVVSTMMIDVITGLELAQIIRTLKITQNISCLLLTSDDQSTISNENIPDKTVIVSKGENFIDQFSDAIVELGIFE